MKSFSKKKKVLFTAWMIGSLISPVVCAAAETEDEVFDTVVVTANRYEKAELDVAGTVDVITAERIKDLGASNVQEVLRRVLGINVVTQGPDGSGTGDMSSKTLIRGSQYGTLVMINGTPINLRGIYQLEDITVDNVEKIEVIKGGGAVLYGSEATGGVINIITKKKYENSVQTSSGNFGRQNHSITMQEGKVGISYVYDKWGEVKSNSIKANGTPYYDFLGSEKNNVNVTYQFDENWSILYNNVDAKTKYRQIGSKDTAYDITRDFVQLNYENDDVKGNVYYNARDKKSDELKTSGSKKGQHTYSREKNYTYGFDVQKSWNIDANKVLLGIDYQNENYNNTYDGDFASVVSRNNYSMYTQWEKPVTDSDTMILSARETWTTGSPNGTNYDNFSGQGQYIHKLNKAENLYVSVGQSFKIPTFNQMFKSEVYINGKPALKPQKGMHYEAGWKKNIDAHHWRVAVFNSDVRDYINVKSIAGADFTYSNVDFKNTGLEISDTIAGKHDVSYNWGVTVCNPEENSGSGWEQSEGRIQLNGGVTYKKDKLSVAATASYLADREDYNGDATKPYLLTDFSIHYSPTEVEEIFLNINNALDRDDIIRSSASSANYATSTNFRLGYKYKF